MKNIEDISVKVEKRKKQLQPLWDKDEENYKLWIGQAPPFDTHKMAINITGTEMPEKAIKVQSSINRSKLDIKVLPPKPTDDTDAVKNASQEERMYYHGFNMADERLAMTGNGTLLPRTAWQVTVPGRVAVRVLVYKHPKTGLIVWDFLPLYPRFLSFEFDSMGLAWGCYETFRSPESIKNEYGKDVPEDSQGKGVSISSHWDREHNVRYITKTQERLSIKSGDKSLDEWEHELESVPIVFLPVARAPLVVTPEGLDVASWGESIFDHMKKPARDLDKLRSIVATQAFINAQPPILVYDKEGSGQRIEEQELKHYPMSVANIPPGLEVEVLPTKDVPPSILTMMSDIKQGIDRVSYTEVNPDVAGHSGAALRILGQDKRDVLTPRVDVLNNMYTQICRMIKKQIIAQKLTIPVKTVVGGEYQVYDVKPKMLDNEFHINAKLISEDAYDEEARLQRAQMVMQLRLKSRKSVMEQEMGEQDVPAEISEMDMEELEAAVPEMKLRRMIKDLRMRSDDLLRQGIEDQDLLDKIKMTEEQLGMLIAQKQQALMGQEQTPPQGGASPTRSQMQGAPR